MNANAKQAVKRSIKHWEGMIKWAKGQEPLSQASPGVMKDAIGEDWYSDYCPLCMLYDENCNSCVLAKKYGMCGDGAWLCVANAYNWNTWIEEAKVMLKQLKSLLGGSK